VYAFTIDDLVDGETSRRAARVRVDRYLATGSADVIPIKETPQEKEERLRPNWGNDPNAQARWSK
jgi:hypothetical protein